MSNLTYLLPESSRLQCPLCNAPIKEARVAKTPTDEKGVVFDCCGNLVTLACLRDSFGIDLEPSTGEWVSATYKTATAPARPR